jgi:hypothetical protein
MIMVELQEKMSPEEEIKKLEQQLEQKKRQFAETGTNAPAEKEIFREVVREHIESLNSVPPQVPSSVEFPIPVVVVPAPEDEKARVKRQEANEATVRILVEKALTGTIEDAVKEAQILGPYMVKELHNHLVDDMYDKLVALRKIKQL